MLTNQRLYLLDHFIVQANKSDESFTILAAPIVFLYVSLFSIHLCWHRHHCCITCIVCNYGAIYLYKIYPIVMVQLEQLEHIVVHFFHNFETIVSRVFPCYYRILLKQINAIYLVFSVLFLNCLANISRKCSLFF